MRRAAAALLALALAAGAAAAAPLRLVSWNAEWLADAAGLQAAGFWSGCTPMPGLPPCDAYRRRGIEDANGYEARKLAPVRQTLRELADAGMDVLALQEVQNAQVLRAVLPGGYRIACITGRRSAQNLAFVVREAARLSPACRELPALGLEADSAPHALRRGLELSVSAGGQRVVLLNVHLKSGCAAGRLDTGRAACGTLQQQLQVLDDWTHGQDAQRSAYAVLGDWNRRLDGGTPLASLSFVEVDRRAAWRSCHRDVDHLALGDALRKRMGAAQARLLPRPDGASDHCPLWAELPLH